MRPVGFNPGLPDALGCGGETCARRADDCRRVAAVLDPLGWELTRILYLLPRLPPPGRPHRLGLPTVVCVEGLSADKPWNVASATRRGSGVAPRACARVYARVLVPPPNIYIYICIQKARALGQCAVRARRPSTFCLRHVPRVGHVSLSLVLGRRNSLPFVRSLYCS